MAAETAENTESIVCVRIIVDFKSMCVIDVCDFKSSTQNQQHLGDMKSSDTEEMESIFDSSSGDEDTSDTLEID